MNSDAQLTDYSGNQVALQQFENDRHGYKAELARIFEKHCLMPLMEQCFPEWFWETLFICSPRGKAMIRSKNPKIPQLQITPR